MVLLPRRIFTLWLQGEHAAPPLVKMCTRRWRRLNPGYEFTVLDARDVSGLLRTSPVDVRGMQHQALSDVLRIKLLESQGGVWVDATAFPVRPLDDWLHEAAGSGFFGFRGHHSPLDVDSWFLASAPGHIIPRLWWREVQRYWQAPRRLIQVPTPEGRYNYDFDPVSSVDPRSSGHADRYPYFWVMYLFTYLLDTDKGFEAAWNNVPTRSGADCHAIQDACNVNPTVSDRQLVDLSVGTEVQKLSYKGPHTERWLTLDREFQEIDQGHSVDTRGYGYDVIGLRLRQQVMAAATRQARTLGGRVRRRVQGAVNARDVFSPKGLGGPK